MHYAVAALDAQGKPGPAAVVQSRIAAQFAAAEGGGTGGRARAGQCSLEMAADAGKLSGYQVLRRPAGGKAEPVAAAPCRRHRCWTWGLIRPLTTHIKCVPWTAPDNGENSRRRWTIRPLVRDVAGKRGPVFYAAFEGNGDAGPIKPKAVGSVRFAPGISGKALDSSRGGYFVYPHQKDFELDGEFAVELRFRETLVHLPVFASCGEFAKHGWFVQIIGGQIRFSLGANVLDAGPSRSANGTTWSAPTTGGRCASIWTARKRRPRGVQGGFHALDRSPVRRPVSSLTDDFQFRGLLDELKLYRVALTAAEIARRTRRERNRGGAASAASTVSACYHWLGGTLGTDS